jgi:hypothetical protein
MHFETKREKVASAFFGGMTVFAVFVAFTNQGRVTPHATLFVLGCCSEGLSQALAPDVLFERVPLRQLFKSKGPHRHGTAAVFSIIATLCFIGAAVFWSLSYAKL